jgi:hypothetical protein
MARYSYLILGMIFLLTAILVAIIRRDLRRSIMIMALAGAVWGPISELWFFRDYWRPESVLGSTFIEDLIYGAGIAATSSVVYKFITRRADVELSPHRTRYMDLAGMLLLYVIAMLVFEMALGVNSILVAIGTYVVVTAYMLTRRRDLWLASLLSAVMMGIIALCGYGIGLNFFVTEPSTLAHIWLLYDKPLGVRVLGYVPLTEVIWYTAWGSVLGILYEYVTGSRLVPLRSFGSQMRPVMARTSSAA